SISISRGTGGLLGGVNVAYGVGLWVEHARRPCVSCGEPTRDGPRPCAPGIYSTGVRALLPQACAGTGGPPGLRVSEGAVPFGGRRVLPEVAAAAQEEAGGAVAVAGELECLPESGLGGVPVAPPVATQGQLVGFDHGVGVWVQLAAPGEEFVD